MTKQEYRTYIKKLVDKIEDEERLKFLFYRANRAFVCSASKGELNEDKNIL